MKEFNYCGERDIISSWNLECLRCKLYKLKQEIFSVKRKYAGLKNMLILIVIPLILSFYLAIVNVGINQINSNNEKILEASISQVEVKYNLRDDISKDDYILEINEVIKSYIDSSSDSFFSIVSLVGKLIIILIVCVIIIICGMLKYNKREIMLQLKLSLYEERIDELEKSKFQGDVNRNG